MVTSNHGSLGVKKIFPGSGGGSVQRGTMAPVIGITAYDDQAEWRNWKARAALLPYAYVNAVRRGGMRGGGSGGGRGRGDEAGRGGGGGGVGCWLDHGGECGWGEV